MSDFMRRYGARGTLSRMYGVVRHGREAHFMRRTVVAGRALAVFAILIVAVTASAPVHAQVLQCPTDAPSGDSITQTLLTQMIPALY